MSNRPRWREEWNAFAQELQMNLARGEREYGDESWRRPASEIVNEVRDEARDIDGWIIIARTRMDALSARLHKAGNLVAADEVRRMRDQLMDIAVTAFYMLPQLRTMSRRLGEIEATTRSDDSCTTPAPRSP